MELRCFYCHEAVTLGLPEGVIFRGTAECPECAEKNGNKQEELEADVARLQEERQSLQKKYDLLFSQAGHALSEIEFARCDIPSDQRWPENMAARAQVRLEKALSILREAFKKEG